MKEIRIPDSLTPITENLIKDVNGKVPENHYLFIVEREAWNPHLVMHGHPAQLRESDYDGCIEYLPESGDSLEWYLKREHKRDDSLWNSFSKMLAMETLTDKRQVVYGIHCNSNVRAVLSAGAPYKKSYLLDIGQVNDSGNDGNARNAFYFASQKLLKEDFEQSEVEKLADFLNGDFKTREYTGKSREIAMEAESVFFP